MRRDSRTSGQLQCSNARQLMQQICQNFSLQPNRGHAAQVPSVCTIYRLPLLVAQRLLAEWLHWLVATVPSLPVRKVYIAGKDFRSGAGKTAPRRSMRISTTTANRKISRLIISFSFDAVVRANYLLSAFRFNISRLFGVHKLVFAIFDSPMVAMNLSLFHIFRFDRNVKVVKRQRRRWRCFQNPKWQSLTLNRTTKLK